MKTSTKTISINDLTKSNLKVKYHKVKGSSMGQWGWVGAKKKHV